MKKNRKIRWDAPVGVKQFHTARFGTERSFPGEFSLFLLCNLLCFGAACGMLQSMFEWELLPMGVLVRVLFMTVIVTALTELCNVLKPRLVMPARLSVGVLGVAYSLFYLFRTKQGDRVLNGLQSMVYEYVGRLNSYYGASLSVGKGATAYLDKAIGFAVSFLCFFLVWYGRVRKKSRTAAVVPLFVLAAGLLVGREPSGVSLFAAVIAVFAAGAAGFRRADFLSVPDKRGQSAGMLRQLLWGPAVLGLLALCLIVKAAGSASAEERVYDGKAKVIGLQNDVLEAVADWSGWRRFNVSDSVEKAIDDFLVRRGIRQASNPDSDFARLDNETPIYEDVAMMKMTLEKKPKSGVYLIGFYAGNYEDGIWDSEIEEFEDACREAGFVPETVTKEMAELLPRRVAGYYGKESLSDFSFRGINGRLQYARANLTKTFLPYFSEVITEGVHAEGDSRYVKEESVTKLSFALWNYDVDDLISVLFHWETQDALREKEPWELWYETYTQQEYLKVPKGMEQVKRVAEEIRNYERDYFSIEGEESVNFDRLNKAYQVADWMRRNTEYSLELPELPRGTDPVEFFLGTSRQGYCMHYAGASVLILRELGVPARYVSGYVTGNFAWNEQNRNYEATVRDNAAHAWVEIYLDGIGWIPIEVTKGYSVQPSGERIYQKTENGTYLVIRENWPEDKEQYGDGFHWSQTAPFITPGAPGGSSSAGTSSQGNAGTPQITETPDSSVPQTGGADEPKPEEPKDASKQEEKKKGKKIDLSLNPAVLVLAFPLLWIYVAIIGPMSKARRRAKSKADSRKMQKRTRNFCNRMKITHLNHRLYRKLRGRGKILKKNLRDEEYEEILAKYGRTVSREERERFMYLVKAAAFSYNDFSEEEVGFCKQIYHKVLYEKGRMDDGD